MLQARTLGWEINQVQWGVTLILLLLEVHPALGRKRRSVTALALES
jgi:hypothetical protein